MEKIIQKAATLIEALPYIQEFRDEIIVVKLGGSAMEDTAHLKGILKDVVFMECVGMKPVIVHGGGKAISRGMERSGIEPRFLHGLRVTCDETIKVVEKVISEEVNPGIVGLLNDMGGRAEGVHGRDVFRVKRKKGSDPDTGKELDWGFVGEPNEVETEGLVSLIDKRIVPVIMPLGIGEDGNLHNINADVAAASAARFLKARKLAFISDVPGLLADADDQDSVIPTLKVHDIEDLIKRKVIAGGMLPKISSAVEALGAGVRKIHLIDGRMTHSLLLEIFTDKGVGTEIMAD